MADGSTKRDTIAIKRTWTFTWEWMPSSSDDTVDSGLGADDLTTLFNTSGVLVFREPDEAGNYALHDTLVSTDGFKKDNVLRRRTGYGPRYWNVSLTLLES
jgi:hypothetical protein